ncbi:MAG: DUF4474 domain-containing protein [Clostridia bacterium]|nr:DUF4474 domain-containing protein [Clostridia bacterium]
MKIKLNIAIKRVLAFVLLCCVLINISGLSIFAESLSSNKSKKLVREVFDFRDEYVKQFRCEDGSYVAEVYSEPVHYMKQGKWEEIDNTLIPVKSVSSVDSQENWMNKSNSLKVLIPKCLNQKNPIELKHNEYSISIAVSNNGKSDSYSNARLSEIEDLQSYRMKYRSKSTPFSFVEEKIEEWKSKKSVDYVSNKTSAVVYNNAFYATDLEYMITPKALKEYIVISERKECYNFEFILKMDGLYAMPQKDGSVHLLSKKNKEMVFSIDSPYMFDASGEYSSDVVMTFLEEDNYSLLKVQANLNWINDNNREFPVIINPTFSLSVSSASIQDVEVDSLWENQNFSTSDEVGVGKNLDSRSRGYYKILLPTLSDEFEITGAEFQIYQKRYYNFFSSQNTSLNVYDLSNFSSWNPSTISWNNQPVSQEVNAYTLMPIEDSQPFVKENDIIYTFDLYNLIKGWYSGNDNNGFMLSLSDESIMRRSIIRSMEDTPINSSVLKIYYKSTLCVCGYNCMFGADCPCSCVSEDECDCVECDNRNYCGCGKLNCAYGPDCQCLCESEDVCACVACKRTENKVEDENGSLVSYSISDGTKCMTESYVYNGEAFPLEFTDTNGNTIDCSYYSNNLVSYLYVESDDPAYEDSYMLFSYDSYDNLSKQEICVSNLTNDDLMEVRYYCEEDGTVYAIERNDTLYSILYDEEENTKEHLVEDYTLVKYYYNQDDNIDEVCYGNGDKIVFCYDINGQKTEIKYQDENGTYSPMHTYLRDEEGNIISKTDVLTGETKTYTENGYVLSNQSGTIQSYAVDPDSGAITDVLYGKTYITTSNEEEYDFVTGETKGSTTTIYSDGKTERYAVVDPFNRITQKGVSFYDKDNNLIVQHITENGFNDTENTAGTYVESYSTSISNGNSTLATESYRYVYNNRGDITEIYDTSQQIEQLLARYRYDEANQLVREDNVLLLKSIVYQYDKGGNIASKTEFPFSTESLDNEIKTTLYVYDDAWRDKLINFDNTPIVYDAIGNPITFNNAQMQSTVNLEWYGRELWNYRDVENEKNIDFRYNEDGYRIMKQVNFDNENDWVYKYSWSDDGELLRYSIQIGDEEYVVSLMYDETGSIIGFNFLNENYYYIKNLLGDVIKIVNSEGTPLVSYLYDAWGNMSFDLYSEECSPASILAINFNPATYRGYYYDLETGLYYTGSRYYNPQWGRFLNTDVFIDKQNGINGSNVFAYCENNPILYTDKTGQLSDINGKGILGFYHPSNNIIHWFLTPWSTVLDPWQKAFGYSDIFDDTAILLNIRIDCLISEFSYSGEDWRIELWKGAYGISFGGEIGFYKNKSKFLIFFTKYDCLEDELFVMNFSLLIESGKTSEGKISVDKLFDISTNEDGHWWLTGFLYSPNPYYWLPFVKPNLIMAARIDFKTTELANKFVTNIDGNRTDGYYHYVVAPNDSVVHILWMPTPEEEYDQTYIGQYYPWGDLI